MCYLSFSMQILWGETFTAWKCRNGCSTLHVLPENFTHWSDSYILAKQQWWTWYSACYWACRWISFSGRHMFWSHQSCLETNMYTAPTFPHKVASTDYPLVRSPKGVLSLSRTDKLYAVGPCAEILYSISARCSTLSIFSFDFWNCHLKA